MQIIEFQLAARLVKASTTRVLRRSTDHESKAIKQRWKESREKVIPRGQGQKMRQKGLVTTNKFLVTHLGSNGNDIGILADWTPCRCRTAIFNLRDLGHISWQS
jgi:hypothetical protein